MSSYSQFVNSPAIGELTLGDAYQWGNNPTVNGKEYLYVTAWKAYSATYANLIAAYKYYGWVTQSTTTDNSWYQTNNNTYQSTVCTKLTCTTNGNYSMWTQLTAWSGTSLSSARSGGGTSITTNNANTGYIVDAIAFGNILCCVMYDSASSQYAAVTSSSNYGGSWGTNYGFTTTANPYGFLAQNGSTDAVAVYQAPSTTSGNILTTTNGTTWVARAASADMGTVRRIAYAPSISAYVYINSAGSIWTAANGYTLTSRAAPSGMPVVVLNDIMQSNMNASSGSSTLIYISGKQTTYGPTKPFLLKITAGPTFSLIDISTLNWYGGAVPTSIVYDGTRYVMTNLYGQVFYSTDEGVTWTRDFNVWNSFLGLGSSVNYNCLTPSLAYVNSQLIFVTCPYNSAYNVPIVHTGKLAQATPDFIGNDYAYYIRIA